MVSRTERTPFGEWWWTVDRLTLAACGALILIGVVMSLAASPPVAARLGLDPFHFVNRQIFFTIPAAIVMFGVSLLTPRQVRRLALTVFAISVTMVALTPYFGAEIKGAKRWLVIFGLNIQPSEFLKPSFVIIIAWLFGESARRPEMPSTLFAFLILLGVMGLLVAQPDFGQTMLIALVWSALFFMAGMRLMWVFGLAGVGVMGLGVAYSAVPHVARRIKRFLDPASGDTFNIDIATESFLQGGWLGRGPGEGTVKRMLPESHTDFVFAVTAEEFGIAFCLVLVAIFSFIVIRSLLRAMNHEEPFLRFGVSGLAMLFGLQSAINMAVNLHMVPAKGMTLPFVSYGGSSLIAMAYGMGMLIALTREQPRAAMLPPHIVPNPAGMRA
jgi:cell division protein FtsW